MQCSFQGVNAILLNTSLDSTTIIGHGAGLPSIDYTLMQNFKPVSISSNILPFANALAVRLHTLPASERDVSSKSLSGVEETGRLNGGKNLKARSMKPQIVVLHPFPTSWEFIKEANRLGFDVWATPPGEVKLPKEVYDAITGYTENSIYNIEGLCSESHKLGRVAMFYPGSEMAVISAAKLSGFFGVPGNPVETAYKTRYKDLMRKELADLVPENNPKYAVIKDEYDLWKAANKIGFPSVFKRTDFAGSFGVKLVEDMDDLEAFFREQVAISKLPFGEKVRPVYLLEEYVEGQEYSIESVTIEGITSVLGVTRKTVSSAPYFVEVAHEFPAQFFGVPVDHVTAMSKLAKEVTEALGLCFCVSHFEVRWDEKTNSPKIMELASRTGGDFIPTLLRETIGFHTWNPILTYLIGTRERGHFTIPTTTKGALVRYVLTDRSGEFKGVSLIDDIRAHPAHLIDNVSYGIGKKIISKSTYQDRVAHFIGVSSDREELESYNSLVERSRAIVVDN